MPYIEEGGSVPKIPKLKSFITPDGELTQEDIIAQVKEMKRLANLKAEKEKLKTLGFTKKLGVPPLPELSTFRILVDDRKRKRSSEILREVFVKENIVVDRMHRNLAPPPGVEGRRGLVIRKTEAGIFYYNGNFDLVFQRELEFYLATIV
ncbi:hypothetical protein Tco_0485188 [Tanacetum coccineum]